VHYTRPSDFERFVLKEDDETVDIDTSEACRLAAVSMACQAARSIDIVSRQLDPLMYDDGDFCSAVTRLVVGSQRARVRALLRHTEPVVKGGHRMVSLAQRLFEASVSFNNPRMAGELGRQFEEMWQTAAPDVNLRRTTV
jgi:hypothetical protein